MMSCVTWPITELGYRKKLQAHAPLVLSMIDTFRKDRSRFNRPYICVDANMFGTDQGYTHSLPSVLQAAVELAAEYKVPMMFVPNNPTSDREVTP